MIGNDKDFQANEVSVLGTIVRYWEKNPQGRPCLIMLHGFTGNHAGLVDTARHIKDVHVVIPDLPGFGESPVPVGMPHSIDTLVEYVAEFIKVMGLKRPIIHGHSLGSVVAARLAKKYPELIDKRLVLQNPTAKTPLKRLDSRYIASLLGISHYWLGKSLPRIGEKLAKSRTIGTAITNGIVTTKDKELRKAITNHHLNDLKYVKPTYYYDIFRSVLKLDILQVAKDLEQEVLIIAGERDNVSPIKYQRQLASELSHVRLVEVKNTGHITHFETPEFVGQQIHDFIVG